MLLFMKKICVVNYTWTLVYNSIQPLISENIAFKVLSAKFSKTENLILTSSDLTL